jgi:hypothetical protein
MIDTKGRLFGAINLVDLAAVLLLVVAAALGVAAYRVFRVPAPAIERIEPATVTIAKGAHVRIIGRNFRHYLRVFAPRTGGPFAVTPATPAGPEVPIVSVTAGALDLQLPDLPPGTYDIYLFDNARQLAHVAGALVLVPPALPRATLRATVRFLVPASAVDQLHIGDNDRAMPAYVGAPVDGAQIEKVDVRPDRVDVMDLRLARHVPDDHYMWMGAHSSQVVADVVLRVPVVATSPGRWDYNGQPVRAGDAFVLETTAAKFTGTVVSRSDPDVAR